MVAVETDDGMEHDVFLKVSARPELDAEGLVNEAIAACLASDLGLPVTEPFLVDLNPVWIESISTEATRHLLKTSLPVGFGSKSAGPQWRIWSAGDRLDDTRVDMACRILIFDALIDNDDRRPTNPNCLVRGSEFRIIDHELAFRMRHKHFPPPEPWKIGNLQRFSQRETHIFAGHLKSRVGDLGALLQPWQRLSDGMLMAYQSALPIEWSAAKDAADAALTHIQTVRDRIDDCLTELERALT